MQCGEESSPSFTFIQMKNSLHQTAFLNAPEPERILPTTINVRIGQMSDLFGFWRVEIVTVWYTCSKRSACSVL